MVQQSYPIGDVGDIVDIAGAGLFQLHRLVGELSAHQTIKQHQVQRCVIDDVVG